MQCPGTPRSKSSGSFTFIGGTTAASENIQSDTQNMDDAAISYSWIDGLPIVSGQFDHDKVKGFSPTCGVNEKGGMNASALYEYTKAAILVLYPDISDEPGKHIVAKINGGPGRFDLDMIAKLHILGFILCHHAQM
eukprot:12781143-Ditylum_brightwellii.AAC.1